MPIRDSGPCRSVFGPGPEFVIGMGRRMHLIREVSMYRSLSLSSRVLALLVVVVALAAQPHGGPVAFGSDPCANVTEDPGPPSSDPEPAIGGRVKDVGTTSGISGAAMQLYRCVAGSGSLESMTTTNSRGDYGFGPLTQGWYYVKAVIAGPLVGKSPAVGTSNPSGPVEVGTGDPHVDFEFE